MFSTPFTFIGGFDPDAQKFIDAVGTLTDNEKNAINELTIDLKRVSLWSKLDAIYPFISSTASSQKWNLKDPRDLDVAHRITWNGGLTHDTTGVLGNGVNGWGDPHYNPVDDRNRVGFWASSGNNIATGGTLFGMVGANNVIFNPRNASDLYATAHYRATGQPGDTSSNTDSTGFYGIWRRTAFNYFKQKETTIATITSASANTGTGITLLNNNNAVFAARKFASAYMGIYQAQYTEEDALALRLVNQAYLQKIGR